MEMRRKKRRGREDKKNEEEDQECVVFCENHLFSRLKPCYTIIRNLMLHRLRHNNNLTSPFREIERKLKSNEMSLYSMMQKIIPKEK